MCSSRSLVNTFTIIGFFLFLCLAESSFGFSIRELAKGNKRTDKGIVNCPPWHPFQCPNGDCIPFRYVCDGSFDCQDEYDEDEKLCTAASRAPPEETSAFLTALLAAHGSNFFVRLFGQRARNSLSEMGGIDRVSVSLSQSPTIESFAKEMEMTPAEVNQMRLVLQAIILGLPSDLSENETADFRFFVQKLQETNFF